MKKKTTVTVGIPAYNEEQNIGYLLRSLLRQKHDNFALLEIVVVSDCSSDRTNLIVSELSKKYPAIKLVKEKKRRGKYSLLNQLFRNVQSDILIVLDADIALVGDNFLEKMVSAMIINPQTTLVAAHNILIRPHDFVGRIIHTNFVLWDNVRLSMPNYESAANYYGSATAYRGSFANSLVIPSKLTDPHLYIYLAAKEINGFVYCREAEVLQYPLSTILDLKKFLNRSLGKRDRKLEKMFRVKTEDVYHFPRRYKLIGLVKTFIRQPFYTPLAIVLSLYIAKFMPTVKANKSPIWEVTQSSKKPFRMF